ncbi:MAG: cytochrome c [Myxococcota bacterium]|jgi:mono/diheme cytochrome c family protein
MTRRNRFFVAAVASLTAGALAMGGAAFAGSAVSFTDDDVKKDKAAAKPAKPAKGAGKEVPVDSVQRIEIAAMGDVAAGEKIYKVNCASCHGFGGGGDGVAASKFIPRPVSHRNPDVMGSLDDSMVFKVVREGDKATGSVSAMPAFLAGVNELDVWDLIAYLRTMHLRIDAFIPGGAYFITKSYRVMSPERIQKAVGEALTPEEEELKVFTVFRSPGYGGNAQFVPYEPGKIDHLKKNFKLGYLAFVKVPGPKGPVEVGLAMDPAGRILKVLPAEQNVPKDIAKFFTKFEGLGKRGKYEMWKVPGMDAGVTKEFYKQYLRMLEAVFMFEKEEKERTWMDEE